MKKPFLLISLMFLVSRINVSAQSTTDPVILTIVSENIPKSEFVRVFKKNNTKDTIYDKKAVNDYLQLYINYKLKVREAFELGMDTVKSFTDELNGYRKQLAQPYLVDKDVSESLLKEAYNRLKTDLRASHILFKCDPNALPKDTLESYNKAIKVRNEILKGDDFAATARKSSEDPSAKDNAGDLGYFTALQMVYPFESAAYNTKLGEVSMPVRTRYGFHLIKVTDSRPAQGEVKVAHIMIKYPAGSKSEDSLKAIQKIDEINTKLKSGENFEDLARQFSDDQSSAKTGGALPMFGTGRMVPEFERAAFALQNVNDVSEPFRTSYGWHIIKLLEKKQLGSYEELQGDLKQKVQKDSRSELSRSSMINKIKNKYGFSENLKAKDEFMKRVDSTLAQGTWSVEKADGLKSKMFSLGNKVLTQQDFATYLASHQTKHGQATVPVSIANVIYSDWQNDVCLAHEESKLDSIYPDFRNLMQEYRDGILLFELTDKKVWSKAVKDTVGLKEFYEKNKANYMWGERVEATIYTCATPAIVADVKKKMKKFDDVDTLMADINKSSQFNLQVKSGKFSKGDNEYLDKVTWATGLTKEITTDTHIIFAEITKVMPVQPKSLEEAKGLITADYQSALEKEWIQSLRDKYPVKVHQEVVDSIANK